MTTSPETPESSDQPATTRGPMALIMAALRGPVNASLAHLKQIASAGPLNAEQIEHVDDVLRALQQISRTIEQYAPPDANRAVPATRGERWDAGEHADAVDDRFQDARVPLEDWPERDAQP